MKKAIFNFLRDEEGATAIEYGLIAGLMATILVAVFTTGDNSVQNVLQAIFASVASAAGV
jgi:pilus assembly protein Flp/PilA